MLPIDPDFFFTAPREEIAKLFYELLAKLEAQDAKIKELEARLNKDSHNSSKPPSSDGYSKSAPKSLRGKSGKKSGGQPGHPGKTLYFCESPDVTLVCELAPQCECGCDLEDAPVIDTQKRQVFDIPPQKIVVTEYQASAKRCPGCGKIHRGVFPTGVDQPVQYGSNIKAYAVYFTQQHFLPLERAAKIMNDLFGASFTEASILSAIQIAASDLKPVVESIKQALIRASLLHVDETGMRVMSKLHWFHSASNRALTYYRMHTKRGAIAMDEIGILPYFKGTLLHDFWKPYFKYACEHGLCNAHLLRELISLEEETGQKWATQLKKLLLEIKASVDVAKAKGVETLDDVMLMDFEDRFLTIVACGLTENPEAEKSGKRGRVKQTKGRNLALRFDDRAESIYSFMHNFAVPFDNNLAERDIRMVKVRQKVSGCFRTERGAEDFATIRSYLSTMRKQGQNIMLALRSLFQGAPILPVFE